MTDGKITRVQAEWWPIDYVLTFRSAGDNHDDDKDNRQRQWCKIENMILNISCKKTQATTTTIKSTNTLWNDKHGIRTRIEWNGMKWNGAHLMPRIQIGDLRYHAQSMLDYTAHWFNFSPHGFSSCHILLTNIRQWDCFSWRSIVAAAAAPLPTSSASAILHSFIGFVLSFHYIAVIFLISSWFMPSIFEFRVNFKFLQLRIFIFGGFFSAFSLFFHWLLSFRLEFPHRISTYVS